MTDSEINSKIERDVASRVDKEVQAALARITIQNADDITITGNLSGMTIGRSTGAAEPRAGGGEGADTPGKLVTITDNGVANIYSIDATFISAA